MITVPADEPAKILNNGPCSVAGRLHRETSMRQPHPRLSTKTKRKALARKMENALQYIWEDGRHDLIVTLEPQGKGQSGRIDLPTLYHAWRQDALRSLERRLDDPPLAKAIREYAWTLDYENHRRGARHILRMATEPSGPLLAGEEARLSWLYDPGHIDRLLQHMIHEDGYAVNTVRNEPCGFISKFLRHRLGEADVHQILAEVDRPNEDDRREVWLTPDDVRRVVSASEWEVRMFLVLTTSTGIDKTPALRIQRLDVDFDKWTLFVRDTKQKLSPGGAACSLPPWPCLPSNYSLNTTSETRPSTCGKANSTTGGEKPARMPASLPRKDLKTGSASRTCATLLRSTT